MKKTTTTKHSNRQSIAKLSNKMAVSRSQQELDLDTVIPRSDVNGGELEFTSAGDNALRIGTDIYEDVRRRNHHILPPIQEDLESKIGKEKMIYWFGHFYKRMMEDPRMAVLFDTSNEEANVSAAVHGKRLALALWSRWTDDDSYYKEIGPSMFRRLQVGHVRAKGCPMRSKALRGGGFTTAQRDSWLGHLWLAGEECQIPMKNRIVRHLATLMGVYGPFVDADYEA